MGTYMSAFIEVDHSNDSSPFSDQVYILSLTEGSFSFNQEYKVFDALAWGRDSQMSPEDHDPKRQPLIAPRGMPSPRSLHVAWDYFYLVTKPSDPPDKYFWPAHRCVSPAIARKWIRELGAHESEVLQDVNCWPRRTWRVVSKPEHYNASWLLLAEFDAALAHHGLLLKELPVEYAILRQAMSLLGGRHGSDRVRLVVWFS